MFKNKSVGKYAMAAAAAIMTVSPAFAAPAQSVVTDRVSAPVSVSENMGEGGGESWILALLAAAAIIGGLIALSGNDSDTPTSP
jgi:hypothetical protein